jgi:hypothetical protein
MPEGTASAGPEDVNTELSDLKSQIAQMQSPVSQSGDQPTSCCQKENETARLEQLRARLLQMQVEEQGANQDPDRYRVVIEKLKDLIRDAQERGMAEQIR